MKTVLLSLTLSAALLLAPSVHAQIEDSSEPSDKFGSATAAGDFNGDGFDDLAIGVPFEDVGSIQDAGAVNVIYGRYVAGGASGLNVAGDQLWHQDSPWVQDVAEAGDQFGAALATGDFNNDGYHDLAVGVPFENVGVVADAGAAMILFGSSAGLSGNSHFWHQDVTNVEDVAEGGDRFGSSLTTGDFDADGFEDLAVGVPYEDVPIAGTSCCSNAGAVSIFYGATYGPTAADDQFWHQNSPGVIGEPSFSALFGYALAAGDLDGDGYDDLAIGAPTGRSYYADAFAFVLHGSWGVGVTGRSQAWIGSTSYGSALAVGDFDGDGYDDLAIGKPGVPLEGDGGAVVVYFGAAGGLNGYRQGWDQDTAGVLDIAEDDDRFGAALAAGDFDNDGYDDLAIGVPSEDLGFENPIPNVGATAVLYGSSFYGLTADRDQLWDQNTGTLLGTSQPDDLLGSALAAGDFDGDGWDELAIGVPGDLIGSVTAAGAVNVLYPNAGGLVDAGNQYWHQNSTSGLGRTGAPTASEEEASPDAPAAALLADQPAAFALEPASPNPFAASTRIAFALPEAGYVRLSVYDALGREVARLVDGELEAGRHAAAFDGSTLPAGAYLVRLEAGGTALVQRVTLLR